MIWRTDFNRKCSAYYLDFATKYKFSYAASFGRTAMLPSDIIDSLKDVYKQIETAQI